MSKSRIPKGSVRSSNGRSAGSRHHTGGFHHVFFMIRRNGYGCNGYGCNGNAATDMLRRRTCGKLLLTFPAGLRENN